MDKWIEITVLNFIGVLSRILANNREKRVLEEVITVTADIDVRKRLQLNKTPDKSEFNSVKGAIFRCRIHTSLSYFFLIAENAFNAGKIPDVRLMNMGYGKMGNRHA